MGAGDVLENVAGRLKEVKGYDAGGLVGYVNVPAELVGNRVAYVTEEELGALRAEFRRMAAMKAFVEQLLNSGNRSRMFSVVSETWNPVTGCIHGCVYCWARALATTKLRRSERYRSGFVPRLNREEFGRRFSGGLVFVSDMGDLFCDGVPDEWILKVFEHARRFKDTYFLFLTKNPARYLSLVGAIPPNAVLGATIETDKDELYAGREHQISKAPPPSLRYKAMAELDWPMKFVSVEPILEFDLERLAGWIREIGPLMVYVGYDNYGHRLPEPALEKVARLVGRLSEFTLVVRKTMRPAWHEVPR